MTKLQTIERSIEALSPHELRTFSNWFAEFEAKQWDRQIMEDYANGRLDSLIAEAKEEIAANKIHVL